MYERLDKREAFRGGKSPEFGEFDKEAEGQETGNSFGLRRLKRKLQ